MAELKTIFTNGYAIEASDVYAEDNLDIVKTFSVENKTSKEYKYNIVFEDLVNTFKTTGFLVYKITSDDGGYNMTDFIDIPKSLTATNTILAYSVTIPAKSIQNYSIEIKYINSETENQDDDQGAVLTGKLYISKGTYKPENFVKVVSRDNPTISERTDFSTTFTETTTGTIYKTNKTEDGSDVYYYSGDTTNNWVYFGSFYWRIIRTNEDGSVRLLYSGTSPDTTEAYIGTSSFNSTQNDPMYLGYMYGTSGSLVNNRTNINDSIIKTYIDTWYKNNLLTNYDKYISKSAIYCNDRSTQNNSYSTTGIFDNGSTIRVRNNAPSYKCGANTSDGLFETSQAIEDKFSVSTTGGGNGQLKYPIALMTADEISFAGGHDSSDLTSPYAWYYTNSQGNSITGNNNWWLLSPTFKSIRGLEMYSVYDQSTTYGRLYSNFFKWSCVVRPVISLDSCVKVTGIGTPDDPYVVDETSCS